MKPTINRVYQNLTGTLFSGYNCCLSVTSLQTLKARELARVQQPHSGREHFWEIKAQCPMQRPLYPLSGQRRRQPPLRTLYLWSIISKWLGRLHIMHHQHCLRMPLTCSFFIHGSFSKLDHEGEHFNYTFLFLSFSNSIWASAKHLSDYFKNTPFTHLGILLYFKRLLIEKCFNETQ